MAKDQRTGRRGWALRRAVGLGALGGVKRSRSSPAAPVAYVQHSINVPAALDARIARCLQLEGLRVFTEFANSAFARKCREIEREHGVDAEGRKVGG